MLADKKTKLLYDKLLMKDNDKTDLYILTCYSLRLIYLYNYRITVKYQIKYIYIDI